MKSCERRRTGCRAVFLLALVAAMGPAAAQVREPDIGYLMPSGGKRGSSFKVVVGGQFLKEAGQVLSSNPGVRATFAGYRRPLNAQRFGEFREALAEAKKTHNTRETGEASMQGGGKPHKAPEKRDDWVAEVLEGVGASPEEIALFFELRDQKADPKRQDNAQLEEKVTLKVEIEPDAPAGPCTLRLWGPQGVSNPLTFLVGDRPEKPEAPNQTITLPCVVNGQILPGETDICRFHAVKGERLVFLVQARDLIPYLADTVPGWFQALLTVRDAAGRPVGESGAFRFSPDPLLLFSVPETGSYTLEIRDALYRGREDFVYRITAGKIPFVTGIFPLGGQAGHRSVVELNGWNLPQSRLTLEGRTEGIGPVPEVSQGLAAGGISFDWAAQPAIRLAEPDNTAGEAKAVPLPSIMDGRLETPGDLDMVAISCRKGETVSAEILARRLNSPLDAFVRVTDAHGAGIAFSDDSEDAASAYLTHHADPRVTFTAPETGTYHLVIGDAQGKGGPDYSYRLRAGHPEPGFSARIVPSAVNGRAGACVPVSLHVNRRNGFEGDVEFFLIDPPAGFTLHGAVVPAGAGMVKATLGFPPNPPETPVPMRLAARARAGDRLLECPVEAADDVLQAFFYHHLVPAGEGLAYGMPARGKPPKIQITNASPLAVNSGSDTILTLTSADGKPLNNPGSFRFEVVEPSDGLTVSSTTASAGSLVLTLHADKPTDKSGLKPGQSGNLILEAFSVKTQESETGKREKRWSLGCLPAVPFTVSQPAKDPA